MFKVHFLDSPPQCCFVGSTVNQIRDFFFRKRTILSFSRQIGVHLGCHIYKKELKQQSNIFLRGLNGGVLLFLLWKKNNFVVLLPSRGPFEMPFLYNLFNTIKKHRLYRGTFRGFVHFRLSKNCRSQDPKPPNWGLFEISN